MQAMDPRQLDNIFKALPLDMIRHEILPRLEPEDIIRFFLASREHLTWIPDLGFDCLVELLTTHPINGTKTRTKSQYTKERIPVILDEGQAEDISNDLSPKHYTPPLPSAQNPALRLGDYIYYEVDSYVIRYPFIRDPRTRAPIEFKFYDQTAAHTKGLDGCPKRFMFVFWTYYAYAAYLWSCAEATWFYAYGERLRDYITDTVSHLLNSAVATGVFGIDNIINGDRIFLKFRAPRELARRKINDKGHYDAVAEMHMDMEFVMRIKSRPFDIHVKLPEVFRYGTALATSQMDCTSVHYCMRQTAHLQYDMDLHDISSFAELPSTF